MDRMYVGKYFKIWSWNITGLVACDDT